MARFKKRSSRRRSFFGKASRRRSSASSGSPFASLAYGAGYGLARPYAINALRPISNMLPFGNLNDEVTMAAIGYAATRMGNPMIKKAGYAALVVEAAAASSQIAGGINAPSSGSLWN